MFSNHTTATDRAILSTFNTKMPITPIRFSVPHIRAGGCRAKIVYPIGCKAIKMPYGPKRDRNPKIQDKPFIFRRFRATFESAKTAGRSFKSDSAAPADGFRLLNDSRPSPGGVRRMNAAPDSGQFTGRFSNPRPAAPSATTSVNASFFVHHRGSYFVRINRSRRAKVMKETLHELPARA